MNNFILLCRINHTVKSVSKHMQMLILVSFILLFLGHTVNEALEKTWSVLKEENEFLQVCDTTDQGLSPVFTENCLQWRKDQHSLVPLLMEHCLQQWRVTDSRIYIILLGLSLYALIRPLKRLALWFQCQIDLMKRRQSKRSRPNSDLDYANRHSSCVNFV